MKIGQQSYFYKVNELTPEDIEFVRAMFLHDVSGGVNPVYNRIFNLFSMVEQFDQLEIGVSSNTELDSLKKNYANNLEEELQSDIESRGGLYLDRLLDGDIAFFEEEEGSAHFINFICMQYMRTKKQQDNLIKHIAGPNN